MIDSPPQHTCKGCNTVYTGMYCNQCGQKRIDRFNLKYLWSLLHQDLLEVDRGLWHTMRDLTLQPGKTIQSYLNGNTKRYFSPVKYLLIIATVLYLLFSAKSVFQPAETDKSFEFETWKTNVLSEEHAPFSIASFVDIVNIIPYTLKDYMVAYFLLWLPFAAFAGQFVFRSLNFTEILITWIYLWGHIMYLLLAFTALTFWTVLVDSSLTSFFYLVGLSFIYMFYLFVKTFRELTHSKWIVTFVKMLISMYGGLFIFFGLVWVALGFIKLIYLH